MTADILQHVDQLLAAREDRKLRSTLLQQGASSIAQVINELDRGKRKCFAMLPPEVQAEVALGLSEHSRDQIFERISDYTISRFLHFLDENDAADLVQTLPKQRKRRVLEHVKPDLRRKVEKLLHYGPETAGGIMDLNFIVVQPSAAVEEVSGRLREHAMTEKEPPAVLVVDERQKTLGYLPDAVLISPLRGKNAGTVAQKLPVVPSRADQEEVLRIAMQGRADVIGVIDAKGQIIGVIRLHDLLKVAQREATEDIYKFAGVSQEEDIHDPASVAIRLRYRWLIVNLGTAFLASFVVSLFQGTIARAAILAAYMPIVAGMGGNAGTQTLAVVVRGLALREVTWEATRHILVKECFAGFVNGLINGAIVALVIYFLRGDPLIGFILGISMIINLMIAGIFGSVIPVTLKALKIDPAVASTIFITTATDFFGYLTFLGLATIALR
jgi:magnesium transporter